LRKRRKRRKRSKRREGPGMIWPWKGASKRVSMYQSLKVARRHP